MRDSHTYDVIVIGAGVTGAITAWLLAQQKARVLLLESGEESPERIDLVGAYARATQRSPGAPYRGRDGDKFSPDPETDSSHYEQSGPVNFRSTYLRRVGGSTWHFLGNVPRLLPKDFKMQSTYGVGVDWPLCYCDLESDYCEAEKLLGVSGDHEQWHNLFGAHRSHPFPMSKIWESYSDRQVTPTIDSLTVHGARLKVMNTPQARNSQIYDGRPACAGNSSCVPICPIQAKYDATIHVRKAEAAGAELRTGAVVTRLVPAAGKATLESVHYLDWNAQPHVVRGRMVVLAAHAIESAKLLLISKIANSSDQVGRNLMDHPQGAGGCLVPEPLFPFRGPPTTSGIDVFRDGEFRRHHAAFRMSLGNDGWGQRIESPAKSIEKLVNEKHFGASLRSAVRDRLTRQFRISYSTELLPDENNRVELSAHQTDALGIPRPKLTFKVPEYNIDAFDKAREAIRQIFIALKGGAPVFSHDGADFAGAGHIMGTCRMGADPTKSVVDANGRCHDHPNLFIVGASVFPTCGTANPTLTAVALTLRANRAIHNDLSSGRFVP